MIDGNWRRVPVTLTKTANGWIETQGTQSNIGGL